MRRHVEIPNQRSQHALQTQANGPDVPAPLKSQLKTGGRLVIPVGSSARFQKLIRIIKLIEN